MGFCPVSLIDNDIKGLTLGFHGSTVALLYRFRVSLVLQKHVRYILKLEDARSLGKPQLNDHETA
jgi:hypothetical protein